MNRLRLKEKFKDTVLFIEIVCMLLLLVLSWSYIFGGNISLQSIISNLTSEIEIQEDMYKSSDTTYATYPIAMAVSTGGNAYGAKYNYYPVSEIYEKAKNILAEALGSAKIPESITDQEFIDALNGKVVYFGFEGNIPLIVLCSWQGLTPAMEIENAVCDFVVMSADEEEITLYYRSVEDKVIMKSVTAARSKTLEPVFDVYKSYNSKFAAFSGDIYKNIYPETIISNKSIFVPKLISRVPVFKSGSEEMLALFSTFGYDQYAVRKYEENNGTQVYVDNLSTISITNDGILHFNVPEKQGIEAYDKSKSISQGKKTLCLIEAAQSIVKGVFDSVDSSAILTLNGFYQDDDQYTISFVRNVNGIPVYSDDGYCTVYVIIKGNVIVSAYMNLRYYEVAQELTPLLPELQAIATVDVKTEDIRNKLGIYYSENSSGSVEAKWYIETEKTQTAFEPLEELEEAQVQGAEHN